MIDNSAVLELASNRLIDLSLSRFGDLQNKNDRIFETGCYNSGKMTMMTFSVRYFSVTRIRQNAATTTEHNEYK